MIEKIFVCSLLVGFLFSFLFFYTGGKIRVFHGKKIRLPGFRIKKFHTRNAVTMPWGTPIFVGMFLTLFGFSGLALTILLHLPAAVSAGIAFAAGLIAAGIGV